MFASLQMLSINIILHKQKPSQSLNLINESKASVSGKKKCDLGESEKLHAQLLLFDCRLLSDHIFYCDFLFFIVEVSQSGGR